MDTREVKVCTRCNQTLPKEMFIDGKCNPCLRLTRRERYKERSKDPEYRKYRALQARKERERNPRSYAMRKKEWLKYNYGITLEIWEDMYAKQNGVCAICLKKCKTKKQLAVDHDHNTNKIRGLLCSKCNRGIGMFEDDVNLLNKAIIYLGQNIEDANS